MHYLFELSTLGELLEVLASQPRGDVWVEDASGNTNLYPTDLLVSLKPSHLELPLMETRSGNHAPIKIAGDRNVMFTIHWSESRQGFIFSPGRYPGNRVHYFGPKELWHESERPIMRGDMLISLCRRDAIENDQPITYLELDDPIICQLCLRKIRASQ